MQFDLTVHLRLPGCMRDAPRAVPSEIAVGGRECLNVDNHLSDNGARNRRRYLLHQSRATPARNALMIVRVHSQTAAVYATLLDRRRAPIKRRKISRGVPSGYYPALVASSTLSSFPNPTRRRGKYRQRQHPK